VQPGKGVARQNNVMVWFFENKGQFRRCELHPDEPKVYRLIIYDIDGTEKVETYKEFADVLRRTQELASELTGAGWRGPFSRDIN
jgi:hypothetical protein